MELPAHEAVDYGVDARVHVAHHVEARHGHAEVIGDGAWRYQDVELTREEREPTHAKHNNQHDQHADDSLLLL